MKKVFFYLMFMIFIFEILTCNVFAYQGCCSSHGGESYCSGGRSVCQDGWVSSCSCTPDYGSSSSTYDSSNSDAQIYFFWLPLGALGLFFIIKSLVKSYDEVSSDEYHEFIDNINSNIEKYGTKNYKHIYIIIDDKEVIETVFFKRKDCLYLVNLTKNKYAYRLYTTGVFDKNGYLKFKDFLFIYDRDGYLYYGYYDKKDYSGNFILSQIEDKPIYDYKGPYGNYRAVDVIGFKYDKEKTFEIWIDEESILDMKEYIKDSKVTIKYDVYERWSIMNYQMKSSFLKDRTEKNKERDK